MRTLKKGDRIRVLNRNGADWLENGKIYEVTENSEYNDSLHHYYMISLKGTGNSWAAQPKHYQVLGIREYYKALCGCVNSSGKNFCEKT